MNSVNTATIDSHQAQEHHHHALSNRVIDHYVSDTSNRNKWSPRLDRLHTMIVEKSTCLKELTLKPNHPNSEHCYRWSTKLQIESRVESKACKAGGSFLIANDLYLGSGSTGPLSMTNLRPSTPRWLCLVKVSLETCRVDHSFLRVLMSNAPALDDLYIFRVVVLEAEARVPEANMMECSAIQVAMSGEGYRKEDWRTGPCIKSSVLRTLRVYQSQGLQWAEVSHFARQLPHLVRFPSNTMRKECRVQPSAKINISPTLGSIVCGIYAYINYLAPILHPLYNVLPEDFSTSNFACRHLTDPWYRVSHPFIPRHCGVCFFPNAPRLRVIMFFTSSYVHCMVLSGSVFLEHSWFTTLEFFNKRLDVVSCWIVHLPFCKNLERLDVIPKCSGSSQYSASEAQQAFMTQVGSLVKLTTLYLTDCRADSLANGFAPEKSLELLRNLTKLQEVDLGFSPDAKLSARDARMLIRWWPSLFSLYGIEPIGNESFMAYMKKHGPKIMMFYHTRY